MARAIVMRGKHLVILLLGSLFLAVGFIFWLGSSGGPGRAFESPPAPSERDAAPADASRRSSDGRSAGKAIADRQIRDELRRQILAAWAEGTSEVAVAARQGRLPAMPTLDGGAIDPAYIQSVFREDMMPMATACYEELRHRRPDAGGRIEMAFKIVGDDKLGGFVEEADVDGGVEGTFGDAKMETCLRESLLSLAFRPPPNDGWVTVVYPLEFAP